MVRDGLCSDGERRAGNRVREGGSSAKIATNFPLELLQVLGVDVQVPLEVTAHLALHLIDLLEGEHALAHDTPGLVGVRVVADDFRRNHECRDK